ncbi:MAG: TIGR04282 family arsenosugar biosynthesis glycosyltransferase [Leptospirales bacterium]
MKREIRLLVFTKAPIPGTVKTRLIPHLGQQGATDLHEQLVLHTLDQVVRSGVGPVELHCHPTTAHPFFWNLSGRYPIRLQSQEGKDLGERLAHAIQSHVQKDRSVIVIGTDCPTISPELIQKAVDGLGSADAVIAPADDGGYVLFGLNRFDRILFQSISWGTEHVYLQTRHRLETLGWSWNLLPNQPDLDRPEDLDSLRENYTDLPGFLTGDLK